MLVKTMNGKVKEENESMTHFHPITCIYCNNL